MFIGYIVKLYCAHLLSVIFRRRLIRSNIEFNCDNIHIENLDKIHDKNDNH